MGQRNDTKQLLLEHCRQYPALRPADLLKFLYQSTFGCGHLIRDEAAAEAYIQSEMAGCSPKEGLFIEPLDGDYCRVHLSGLNGIGLTSATLARLFALSANAPCGSMTDLERRLDILLDLAKSGQLPFSRQEAAAAVEEWRQSGCLHPRHSAAFRNAYSPAYRVLRREHARLLPVAAAIDRLTAERSHCVIALEGGSASGKSTTARLLSQLYDCNLFHMDDFFLRPEQRTAQRYAEPGGNIDRERFLEEVLLPLSWHERVAYRRFDCSSFSISPAVEIAPKPISIVEGAYSMHPELAGYYDLSVFLNVTPEVQRSRILQRNTPEFAERFFALWIPMEETYFLRTDTASRCDMILEAEEEYCC